MSAGESLQAYANTGVVAKHMSYTAGFKLQVIETAHKTVKRSTAREHLVSEASFFLKRNRALPRMVRVEKKY